MLTYKQKLEFIARVAPLAQASQSRFGVPASTTLAQAILESRWGRSRLTIMQHNFFGIKARIGEDYAEYNTMEDPDGPGPLPMRVVKARFRKFRSPQESFDAHARLLASLARYQPAMAAADDPLIFATRLQQCGYATDPMYPVKLMKLVGDFELTQYDPGKPGRERPDPIAAKEKIA